MNIDVPELSKILVTFVLGILGGIFLEYFRHRWTLRIERDKLKRDVLLECEIASASIRKGDEYDEPVILIDLLSVKVINTGVRPVVIIDAGILFDDGSRYNRKLSPSGMPQAPKKLEDGDFLTIYLEFKIVVSTMLNNNSMPSSIYAEDSTRNLYKIPISQNIKSEFDKYKSE
jgi:hypothetical protein